MRKIAVFTGTRAEYGLLFWLIKDLDDAADFELQLLVSGAHLSPEFGQTVSAIESDGFDVDERIEMLVSSSTPVGTAKSVGLGIIGYADALKRLDPDCLIVLGDRFETFAVAQAAMFLRIPIAHIHGGEITEGAYDDAMRHAITKLSYLHFTSTEEHRRRVIQLGEAPERVYNTGAIGLDHLERTKLMELHELSDSLEFDLSTPYFLVTYHPVTLVRESAVEIFEELLAALDQFPNFKVIVTYPNADDGGRELVPLIERYASLNLDRVLAMPSLGHIRYLSAVKFASVVIGNSSSGIIEVPSFNVPSINIGLRQRGRTVATSVHHSDGSESNIKQMITVALTEPVSNVLNPYGKGDVSGQVLTVLRGARFSKIKKFYDLN